MKRWEKYFVLFVSIVCLFNLFTEDWKYAAMNGFVAIMWVLIGIEEQV